ncbi:unnamed protein product [Boreogadus saida]
MSRKKLAWANKEVETFVCILGEEDVVYDVYVAAAAIDIRPTTKAKFRCRQEGSLVVISRKSVPDQSAFISRMLACMANNGPNWPACRRLVAAHNNCGPVHLTSLAGRPTGKSPDRPDGQPAPVIRSLCS